MRTSLRFSLLVVMVAVALNGFAQVRGRGRVQGVITEKGTGKPVAGATITIASPTESTQPITTKSDARGRWSALGLTSGQWNVDIVASGYETTRGTVNVSEAQLVPLIRTELAAVAKVEETTVPVASTQRVPQAAVDAVKHAQEIVKVSVGDTVTDAAGASHTATADEVKTNAKTAAAELESALPQIPGDTPELQTVRRQVQQLMAQAYYRAGDLKSAIATLESLNASGTPFDEGQSGRDMLLVNLYLESGQLDKGKALLEKIPAGSVTDPLVYQNVGILFLNKANAADAWTYFDRAVKMDDKKADSYYYRALAEMQLKKVAEARADLQQVIALAPESPEAADAKKLLPGLK